MAYPKILLKLNISETAKLVYMLLLDRARLSMKNGDWQDEQGRVFVLYTIPNLAKDIGKGENTVKKALNQLLKQGLILKQSLGPGQPSKIYVKIQTENSPTGQAENAWNPGGVTCFCQDRLSHMMHERGDGGYHNNSHIKAR